MVPLLISGNKLEVDDVAAVADCREVALDLAVLPKVNRSRAAVEDFELKGK